MRCRTSLALVSMSVLVGACSTTKWTPPEVSYDEPAPAAVAAADPPPTPVT